MKINEKSLVSFCTSSTPSDREGWLFKRGDVNKSFQKRWCVLKGNLLFYSEKPGDREPVGVIILEGCAVELAEDETEFYAFKIVFHGDGKSSGRVYTLGTGSMEDLEAWMKLIASASYDYMKLMVVELEQQLAEVEERERQQQLQQQDGGGGGPQVPPRTRTNPFNNPSASGGRRRKGWAEYHQSVGIKILRDRQKWAAASRPDSGTGTSPEAAPETTVSMEEDNLLVVF